MIIDKKYSKWYRFTAIVLAVLLLASAISPLIAYAFANGDAKAIQEPMSSIAPTTVCVEETTSEPISTEPEIILIDTPIAFTELTYIPLYDIELSNSKIETVKSAVVALELAIDSKEYSNEAVLQMRQEVNRLCSIISFTEADVRHYTIWETEHYYAAKGFEFLKQAGYSDVVACGIIGNMMVETSGGTLNLKPTVYNPSGGFYGLCQWSLYYYPEARDLDMYGQLNLLMNTIEKEFKNFGSCYRRGFAYEDFLTMEDPADAALAFAKVYERCGSGSYGLRQRAAMTAYKYFTY